MGRSSKETVLITGAAGFIGSNLCHYLIERDYRVVAVDALKLQGDFTRIEHLLSNRDFYFEEIDLCSNHLREVLSKYVFSNVVHLAAESHVDRSIESSEPFWKTNVLGTHNLFESLRKTKLTRIINQITDEVYGEKPDGAAVEGDVFRPTSPYPCSKAAQYFVGKSFFNTYDLPIISTFPVNNFGPRQDREKLIPKFIWNLLHNQRVPLMASSHFERDWLPVEDMCRAFEILLQFGVPGEDYNIGAGNHHTNLEITKKLLSLLNRGEDMIEIVPDRIAHDCRYAVNSDKIRKLEWSPQYNFDEYLEYTVNWYRKRICS